jgi:hypothetical protein
MGSFSDLTLGDLSRALTRYRPVAISVAVILLALFVLPKPKVIPADLAGDTATGIPAAQTAAAPTTDVTAQDLAPGATTLDSFSPPTTFSPTFDDSTAGSDTFFTSPTTAFPESDFTFAPTTGSDQPLRVVAKAWATRTAGTPLATNGVPAGTLPVGTRAGQDDKLSFVRLSGDEDVLRLTEDATGARTIVGAATVQACLIKDAGWPEGEAIAIADAPQPDAGSCVEGTRSTEGIWSFDVAAIAKPTDERGFALRPGAGAGADFQVAFKVS